MLGIQKFVISNDPNAAYVLLVKAQEVDHFMDEEVLLANACCIYLPHNKISESMLNNLWKKFPSAWWIDLSNNKFSGLPGPFPLVLGLLNLSGNAIKKSDLSSLTRTHILRLHLSNVEELQLSGHSTVNSSIAEILPNVWVINDDFISSADRRDGTKAASSILEDSSGKNIEWSLDTPNRRVCKLIRAIQNCSPKAKFGDYFRLEILLEEYLQEASYFNAFVQQINILNNSSHRHVEFMPFVDLYALMLLPHRMRLDLTVVLTTSIMYHIPQALLRDALIATMAPHISPAEIDQLYVLPRFVKTALICLLRRVTKHELLEWDTLQQYCSKPPRLMSLSQQKQLYAQNAPDPLHYLDSSGFQFLRPVKQYLEQAIEASNVVTATSTSAHHPGVHAPVPFSELELEIIDKLPDVPTHSSATAYFKEKAAEEANNHNNNIKIRYFIIR